MLVFYDYETFKYDWLAVFKDINGNKTVIVSAGSVHFEPMGIYKGNKSNGVIIIPNDKSNSDRAKQLLTLNNYNGKIIEALHQQNIITYIEETFGKAVIPYWG